MGALKGYFTDLALSFVSAETLVFLNGRASLPHVPLRPEISVLWVWKKASDDTNIVI